MAELLSLRESTEVSIVGEIDPIGEKTTVTVEALIMPGCRMIGRTLGSLRLRRRYSVYPIALRRRDAKLGPVLEETRLRIGDTLLLEGAPEDIQLLAEDEGLAELTEPSERPYRRHRAPIMLGLLAMVVVGSAAG